MLEYAHAVTQRTTRKQNKRNAKMKQTVDSSICRSCTRGSHWSLKL